MKKSLKFLFCAIFAVVAISCVAQGDTSVVNTPTISPAPTVTVSPEEVQGVVSGVLDILGALGVSLGGWKTLIVILSGVIWRLIEKTRMKQRHANELETIASSLPVNIHTQTHISRLRQIINRLRGIKTPPQ